MYSVKRGSQANEEMEANKFYPRCDRQRPCLRNSKRRKGYPLENIDD